ncbi:hypothetical protein ACOSQ3_022136 [Xanthoceras sorbifolium]
MGKRAEIKKIKATTRYQITYCKRKNSLLRKSHEISILCDIDLALVVFSPNGRVSSFCSREKMRDVIERYLDLPPQKRYLFFEQSPDEEPTVSEVTWFERKLKASLELVKQRKSQLIPTPLLSNISNFKGIEITKTRRNRGSTQSRLRREAWINQFRAKGRGDKSQDLHGQANRTSARALNDYAAHHPAMATFPSGDRPGSYSANYSLVLNQPVITDQFTLGNPMQQLRGLIGSSSAGNMGHGAPIWIQNYPTPQTCNYLWENNLSSQNMVAPTSQFQVNPSELYWTPTVTHNTSQNPTVTLPLSSDPGILSSTGNEPHFTINNGENYEPQFTNSIATAAVTTSTGNNDNIGDFEPVPSGVVSAAAATTPIDNHETGANNCGGSESGPSQVIPPPASYTIPSDHHNLSNDQVSFETKQINIVNNLSSQNMVAPTSQFQANPNEVYQYSNVNDLILPSSSNLGINTINNYESHRPQFTNSIATAASSAASVAATFNDNGTGPSQVIPPQASHLIPNDHHNLFL